MSLGDELDKINQRLDEALHQQHLLAGLYARLKHLDEELQNLYVLLDQTQKQSNHLLKLIDTSKFSIDKIITKLFNRSSKDASETAFIRSSLIAKSIKKEIELLEFEQSIINKKHNEISSIDDLVEELIKYKAKLLGQSNIKHTKELSAIGLKLLDYKRRYKILVQLINRSERVQHDLENIRQTVFGLIKVAAFFQRNNQQTFFTFQQNKKIKWVGRKTLELKVEMEKLHQLLSQHIPTFLHNKMDMILHQFIIQFVGHAIKKNYTYAVEIKELTYMFQDLIQIFEEARQSLLPMKKELQESIFDLSEERRQIIITFGKT